MVELPPTLPGLPRYYAFRSRLLAIGAARSVRLSALNVAQFGNAGVGTAAAPRDHVCVAAPVAVALLLPRDLRRPPLRPPMTGASSSRPSCGSTRSMSRHSGSRRRAREAPTGTARAARVGNGRQPDLDGAKSGRTAEHAARHAAGLVPSCRA